MELIYGLLNVLVTNTLYITIQIQYQYHTEIFLQATQQCLLFHLQKRKKLSTSAIDK